MSKFYLHFKSILRYALFVFVLFSCQTDDQEFKEQKLRTATVSKSRAMDLFNSAMGIGLNDSLIVLSKSTTKLTVIPDWETFTNEDIGLEDSQLSTVEALIETVNDFKMRLVFIEVEGTVLKAIEATDEDSTYDDGSLENGFVYYFNLDGSFSIGYGIENGMIISRYMKKKNVSTAGIFSITSLFSFQESDCDEELIRDTDFCINLLNAVSIVAYRWSAPATTSLWMFDSHHFNLGGGSSGSENDNGGDGRPNEGPDCIGDKVLSDDGLRCECPQGMVENLAGDCQQNCPDKLDRENDSNKGFFTEKQFIDGDSIDVIKATFAINSMFGLSSSDIDYITQGVENVYDMGSMPLDLKMNFDDMNSQSGNLRIKFTALEIRMKPDQTTAFYDTGEYNVTTDGDVVLEIVRNIRIIHASGTIDDRRISNNAIIKTLAHELGHSFNWEHLDKQFPEKNNIQNVWNLMNSLENDDEELQNNEGFQILPEQKKVAKEFLTKIYRDGKDC